MTNHIDQIKNHEIFKEMSNLEESIEQISEFAESEIITYAAWERLKHLIGYIKKFLQTTDPQIISRTVIDSANIYAKQANEKLNNFKQEKNISHLAEANSSLDNTLNSLGQIPKLIDSASTTETIASAANFKSSVGKLTEALEKKISELRTEQKTLQDETNKLTTQIAQEESLIKSITERMQQEFLAAEGNRQAEATKSASERTSEFEKAEKERAEKFSARLSNLDEDQEKMCKKLTKTTEDLISSIREKKAFAEKVVGIISTETVAHGYGKSADQEAKAAKSWGRATTCIFSIWITVNVFILITNFGNDMTWGMFARQLLSAVAFLTFAGFTVIQVTRHRRAERISRRKELEIAAIDPFLATFDDKKRDELKEKLVFQLFGQQEEKTSRDFSPIKILDQSQHNAQTGKA